MFNTGSPVKGDAFIDRKKHLPLFRVFIENKQHFMIKAPRRFGKTSIIKHIFEYEGGYKYVYIDFKKSLSIKKIAYQIIDQGYGLLGVEGFVKNVVSSTKDAFLNFAKNLQSIKLDGIGEITIKELSDEYDEIALFLHSLDTLNTIASKLQTQIYFIADEFQDILALSDKHILDTMRATIQHHENITYIFLGSIESIMTSIFEEKKSPFFHFAKIVELPLLDIEEVYLYAKNTFEAKNIKNIKAIKVLLEATQGHPDYTMQALQMLYFKVLAENIDTLDENLVNQIIESTFHSNEAFIDEIITSVKTKKHHLLVLSNIANQKQTKLDSKTLYNVRISLENMGLVKKVAIGTYQINDIFLEKTLKIE